MHRKHSTAAQVSRSIVNTGRPSPTWNTTPDLSEPTDVTDFASAVGNQRASAIFQNNRSQNSSLVNAFGRTPSRGQILGLQRLIGNRATTRMINRQPQSSGSNASGDTVQQIEQAIDTLSTKKIKKDARREEIGAGRTELIDQIRALREQISQVGDEQRKADLYQRLNTVVPYYVQVNANVLKRGNSGATQFTCNITSLSMNLQGLGKSQPDFTGDSQLMSNMATVFSQALKDRSNTSDPQALRLPDFLQLVVVYVALTTQGDIQPTKRKGLGKDIATLNALAVSDPEAFKQQVIQARDVGAQLVTDRRTFYHFSQFFGVDSTPIWRNWGRLSLSDYQQQFTKEMKDVIGSGQMVIAAQDNPAHFVRIDTVSDDGVMINDPGSYYRDHKLLTWREAQQLGMLFSGYIVMKNLTDSGVRVTAKVPTTIGNTQSATNAGAGATGGQAATGHTATSSSQGATSTTGQTSPPGGQAVATPGQAAPAGGNTSAPWITPNFYERAHSINQKYMEHPPQAGWPYFPEWRALWEAGKYHQFADAVADFQFFAIPSPVSEVDGILGGKTFHAIARTHPQYARVQTEATSHSASQSSQSGPVPHSDHIVAEVPHEHRVAAHENETHAAQLSPKLTAFLEEIKADPTYGSKVRITSTTRTTRQDATAVLHNQRGNAEYYKIFSANWRAAILAAIKDRDLMKPDDFKAAVDALTAWIDVDPNRSVHTSGRAIDFAPVDSAFAAWLEAKAKAKAFWFKNEGNHYHIQVNS